MGVRPECRALSICRLLSVDRALSERPLLSNHRPSPRTQSNKRTWRRLSSAPLLILRCTIMMRTGPNSLFHPTRLSPKRRQFFRRRHLQLLLHKRLSCLHHHCRLHSQHNPPPQAPHIPRSAQSHPEDRNESHASQHSLFLARLLSLSSSLDFNSLHITVVCSNCELNPHADLGASLCYDYLNFGYCKHEYLTGICNYRHVPNNHIDAVVDRMQSGKVGVGRGAER